MKNRLFLLIFTLLCASCSKVIEVEIPNSPAKLVVNSTIVPFEMPYPKYLSLSLNSSKHIFDTTQTSIKDAFILYYKNGVIMDTLKFDTAQNEYLIKSNFSQTPKQGDTYSLKATKQGYVAVEATTTIPEKVEITTVAINPEGFYDDMGNLYIGVELTFKDPIKTKNFYQIAVTDLSHSYKDSQMKVLFTNESIVTSLPYYPSEVRFDVNKPNSLLFPDEGINGKSHTLTFFYMPGRSGDTYINHYISIHLRNITEEYYQHYTTMQEHLNAKQENTLYGMGEPVPVVSNIKNGFGIFAGFNDDIRSFRIDQDGVHPAE